MGYDWQWFWVWRYREALWNGLVVTLELNFVVLVISTIVGMLVSLARLSRSRILRVISRFYIDLFRTVPLLVLIFWFYFAFPLFTKKYFIFGSFTAAVLALSLNFSAFIAEIFRAGIESVPKHQIEAARALGLSQLQTMRYVTLPLAIRLIIPPLTGQYINGIKLSILASVIAVPELFHTVQTITTEVFCPIEMYSALAGIFLIILLPGTWVLYWLERKPFRPIRLQAERIDQELHIENDSASPSISPAILSNLIPDWRKSSSGTLRGACSGKPLSKEMFQLSLSQVSQSYNGRQALNSVSFEVSEGEILSIIGPNGAGKTTLLRCISGLLPIREGTIRLMNKTVVTTSHEGIKGSDTLLKRLRGRTIGIHFQRFDTWPHMTVLENVALPLRLVAKMKRHSAKEQALKWLDIFGLKDKIGNRPYELSGGQHQRLALARVLALEPQLLLLDEATSSLDPEWVAYVRDITRMFANKGAIVINVCHRLNLVKDLSDRVMFLKDGMLVEEGPAKQVLTSPETPQLRLFLNCS